MLDFYVLKDIHKICKKDKVKSPKKLEPPKKNDRQLLRDTSMENFLKYQWSWTL